MRERVRRRVGVFRKGRSGRGGERPAHAQLHHRFHAGDGHKHAASVLRKIRRARWPRILPGRAVGFVLGRAILVRALIIPGLDRITRGVARARRVERDIEAQQHALIHGYDFARKRHGRAGEANPAHSRERVVHVAPTDHLKTREVKLAVGRIHCAVQRREIKGPRHADDGGLKPRGPLVEAHDEKLGAIKTDVDQRVVERAEFRIEQPDLRKRRGVYRMRQPRQRLGDRRRIFFFGQEIGEEAVELAVAHEVQRRRGDVLALLVARGDETGAKIHADVGLPKTVAEHGRAASIRGDAQDAAVVFAERRRLLAALGDHKLTVRREPERRGEFAQIGRLREGVGK